MPNEAADIGDRAMGRTVISADGTPLGFAATYFKPNGKGDAVAIVVFYGGPNQYFMKKYLPMALRGMKECVEILMHMGITHAYAVCDRQVPDAERFIKWAGGELVPEAQDPNGQVFKLVFANSRFVKAYSDDASPGQSRAANAVATAGRPDEERPRPGCGGVPLS